MLLLMGVVNLKVVLNVEMVFGVSMEVLVSHLFKNVLLENL